ncbi:DUF2339 domain-containing protein [Thermomonas sp.]|uniref:DUF2339 domain-containing protein n=1 Tax=Thermomonas sp. TaxID=1971895 RepID=UPI0026149D9C|nr:DUF2339 domain-containing protein [Thermomonas sp.]MCO5054168.1 DUF2339 domain-containing protein [Thermomonas sp.]
MDELVAVGLVALLALLAMPVLLVVALVKLSGLRQRVEVLERAVSRRAAEMPAEAAAPATAGPPAEPDDAVAAEDPAPWVPAYASQPRWSPLAETPATRSRTTPVEAAAETAAETAEPAGGDGEEAQAPSMPPPLPPSPAASPRDEPDWVERGVERVKGWFTTGNVPVKVGMLVLLAGVAALLRYASDQGWLRLPIEFRLAGVAAAALAGLVFGWRKRDSHRSFALALQGGAIGILLLVTFAASKRYDLLGAGPAFAISVAFIAGLSVMAVLQDSRTLVILGVLAGFLAPLWLSTGGGNHVALFSYYAALNAGIFAIAWVRPWRVLNLLGFAFTFGIGTLWGLLEYRPEHFASTEPFLLLFFGFYLLLPILYARKAPTPGGARIDGSLLFGTPLVAFSMQAGMLPGQRMTLALCALGLAALYAILAKLLLPRSRMALLARGYAVLAVGFATLAVPLALSARATASVFALEGAGLVWLGFMQSRRLPRWAGLGLQLAAAFALLTVGFGALDHPPAALPFANAAFMSGLLVACGGFAVALLYRRNAGDGMAVTAYLWGLFWWLLSFLREIEAFADSGERLHWILLLVGATGWLVAEYHRRSPARALALTTLVALLLAFPLAWAQWSADGQPFAGHGAWIWPLFAAFAARALVGLRNASGRVAGLAQLAWWLLWPTVLSLLAAFVGERFVLADGWVGMLLALPWLVLAAVSLRRAAWLAPPLGAGFAPFQAALRLLVFLALGLWWVLMLFHSGHSAPLPWIVVFNPLDLAQIAMLLLLAVWLRSHRAAAAGAGSLPVVWLALAGLLLVSVLTLRAVCHWGGVAWDADLPGASLSQTGLTVVWSLLGVAGWFSGSRRGHWGLWLAGALLMGVVLLKLLLVDRGNLGDLLGIGAFIVYGLLCTLVGWLAPVPPRRAAMGAATTGSEGKG